MKSIINHMRSLLMTGVILSFLTSCNSEQSQPSTDPFTETTELLSVSIVPQVYDTKALGAVNEMDPTLSLSEGRSGHTMVVTLGEGESLQERSYHYTSENWTPVSDPVVFPDNSRQSVSVRIFKENPGAQDGTAQALIDADEMFWSREDQPPVTDMANVPVLHKNAIFQFNLDNIAASEVKIGNTEKAYNIPETHLWQYVAKPGQGTYEVSVTILDRSYSATISSDDMPTSGVVQENCKYILPLVFEGDVLKVGNIIVKDWAEGNTGIAESTQRSRFIFEGIPANTEIKVYISSSETPMLASVDASGMAAVGTGTPIGNIRKISINDKEYLIGRAETSMVWMKFDNSGNLVLRNADENGYFPINTVAETRIIEADKKYLLEADLDFSDCEWAPIPSFSGEFDGGNFTINNFNALSADGSAGLFASNSGVVKNVCFNGISTASGQSNAGLVTGVNTGTIENCVNKGQLSLTAKESIGGICGHNNGGKVMSCGNTGNVKFAVASSPTNGSGGVCGYSNNAGTISHCYNQGYVNAPALPVEEIDATVIPVSINLVGGVLGHNYGATVLYSYNSGTVANRGGQTGGVCGQNQESANVTACYNKGIVVGNNALGGVAGRLFRGKVTACYNAGTVKSLAAADADAIAGGISGFLQGTATNAMISACYNTGTILHQANKQIGIIIGQHKSGVVSACFYLPDETLNLYGSSDAAQNVKDNAEFSATSWPSSSINDAWKTRSEDPSAYWKSLGSFGGSYPEIAFE